MTRLHIISAASGSQRWLARTLGGALLALVAVLMSAGAAFGHTDLVESTPTDGAVLAEAPREARLTFTEPVRVPPGGIRVVDAAGSPVPVVTSTAGADVVVEIEDELEAGGYVLAWRVVPSDGHPLSGTLSFSVSAAGGTGNGSGGEGGVDAHSGHDSGRFGSDSGNDAAGAPDATSAAPVTVPPPTVEGASTNTEQAQRVAQGVQYATLLLAAGLVVFILLLPRSVPAAARRRLWRLSLGAGGAAVLASVTLAALAGAQFLGVDADSVLSSAAVWELGLAPTEWITAVVVTGGLVVAITATSSASTAERRHLWRQGLGGVGATAALTGPALVGHTRSFDPEALLILTDIAHLTAGAVWFGGLVGLALCLPMLARDSALSAHVLARFSTAAAASLAVLTVMGSLLSWRILASWDLLFTTSYGALLLVKIGIVAVAALVAVVNRYVLLPRMRSSTSDRTRSGGSRGIRRAVAVEAILLVAALGVTGYLTHQAPHADGGPAAAATSR